MSSNSWISHVKNFQHENNCTYKEALQGAKETYEKQGGSLQSKKISRFIYKKGFDKNKVSNASDFIKNDMYIKANEEQLIEQPKQQTKTKLTKTQKRRERRKKLKKKYAKWITDEKTGIEYVYVEMPNGQTPQFFNPKQKRDDEGGYIPSANKYFDFDKIWGKLGYKLSEPFE